jgi:hypothetical protein
MIYIFCDEWALTEETTQALDIRGAKLTPADALLLLQNIVCNNGALASPHVGTACIPAAQMARIIAAMQAKESANVLLCGVSMKETVLTELDVSGKMLGAEGALVVADYMQANQGLRALSLSRNHMATAEAGLNILFVNITKNITNNYLFWLLGQHWANVIGRVLARLQLERREATGGPASAPCSGR